MAMALAHNLPITPARSVRASEWPIETVTNVVDAVRRDRALAAEFGDVVGLGAPGLLNEIALLTPHDTKGLEFDVVIVVDPAAIVAASETGAERSTWR